MLNTPFLRKEIFSNDVSSNKEEKTIKGKTKNNQNPNSIGRLDFFLNNDNLRP